MGDVVMICQCAGTGWVCENHPDKPWEGLMPDGFETCCGGLGAPCEKCNPCDYDNPPQKTGMVEIYATVEDETK